MAIDKAVDSTQLNSDLTSVANAIRTKGGTSAQLAFPSGFVSAVNDLPEPVAPTIQSLTVTPTTSQQTFNASGVDGYKPVTVNRIPSEYIIPSGSETKTANGTYDVTNLAQLIVNVAGGGSSGLEYETGTYTPAADFVRPTINFANSHTEPPILVLFADATGTDHTETNSNYACCIANINGFIGGGVPSSASSNRRYGIASYVYRASGNPSQGVSSITSLTSGTSSGISYWVTNTGFNPYTASTSRYWRAGRTFKWIAVWKPTT